MPDQPTPYFSVALREKAVLVPTPRRVCVHVLKTRPFGSGRREREHILARFKLRNLNLAAPAVLAVHVWVLRE
jgi:hypothetical protein